jgi:HAMP domain-containing protein
MSRNNKIISRALAKEFRRPSELEQLKRFVRSLSAFQPDKTLPAELTDLLGRIDEAERLANSDRSRRKLPARRATS